VDGYVPTIYLRVKTTTTHFQLVITGSARGAVECDGITEACASNVTRGRGREWSDGIFANCQRQPPPIDGSDDSQSVEQATREIIIVVHPRVHSAILLNPVPTETGAAGWEQLPQSAVSDHQTHKQNKKKTPNPLTRELKCEYALFRPSLLGARSEITKRRLYKYNYK